MLWIGERTRELDGAHVEFLRGVGNPIGCKVGPTTTVTDVLQLCDALNPARIPGRLTLISRMGADHVETKLRPLLRAVVDAGHPVVWACDPMHGNTYTAPNGRKTRHFESIMREIEGFVSAHRAENTWPGGIHVELTGENVTECLGGADDGVRQRPRPSLRDGVRPAAQRPPGARARLPHGRADPGEPADLNQPN